MKTNIYEFTDFVKAIENNEIVYLFGTGISSALTGKVYSWKKWITDGINCLKNKTEIDGLKRRLNSDNGADNLVTVAGLLLKAIKRDGAYQDWMQSSFESNTITNFKLAETLSKLVGIGDVFATTNYDLLLEKATDLLTMTYSNTANAFNMLNKKQSTHVIHIHGVYDSINKIDDIIADKEQYESILNNEGAQFIQNLLGTRTLIFIGCGKTTDDLNVAKFIDFAKTHLKLDRKYYYLHKKDQQPSGLPENIVAVPYGSEYSDLTDFLEGLCDVRLTSFMNRNPLVGRNVYKKECANIQGLSAYHFTHEEIKFCGREAELKRLNDFISSDKTFSWWAVTGQGGSGKSRLALELLNRTKTEWFGFFLSDLAKADDVETLTLFKNTLIIVDYVKGKERTITQILARLINHFAETEYKLRVLFLERDGDTATGSWYSELTRSFPGDALSSFQTNEYAFSSRNHAFLNLGDMTSEDILQFIGYVCRKNGLPDDSVRDVKLMEDYGKKFEKLQFRPLFVQMYVEAWIENDCTAPRYDGYEDLLKFILEREQKRWLHASGGNVRVCSALIRLVVFANCNGKVKISSLPESLKSEWDIIENYVRENNFPGKQSEDAFKSLINEICQSGEHSAEHINPLYPDILKEYMLIYYCSDQERMVLADYLWGLRSEKFSALVIRCIYDFPFNEAINSIVTNCDSSADNPCVLAARLNYLKLYVIKNFKDAKKLRSLLKNEYEFWRALIVKPKTEDSKILNIIKFCGLTLCAQQFGAWLEIDRMICVLEEAMSITGGDELNVLKVLTIQERIRALSLTGFTEEAQVLENKFSSVLRSDTLADVNGVIKLDNLNVVLINYLKVGNFYKAKEVLKSMNSLCDMENIEEVKILSLSCLNMARLSFIGEKPKYLYGSINILQPYYERYSQDTCVASRYLQSKLQTFQYEFFVKKVDKAKIESELYELEKQMPSVTDEYSADVWAMCKVFKLNFIKNDKNELINQLENSVKILQNVSQADTVVQVYIDSAIALHTNVLKDKVTKEEVDKAYSYMLRFPESESIRGCFFEMLEKSTEANNRAAYMPHQVLSNALSDIMLNPLNDSGIPELDKLYEKAESIDIPYVREHRKIGRNEPCPCGSGKKFKKCCLGNGIYD